MLPRPKNKPDPCHCQRLTLLREKLMTITIAPNRMTALASAPSARTTSSSRTRKANAASVTSTTGVTSSAAVAVDGITSTDAFDGGKSSLAEGRASSLAPSHHARSQRREQAQRSHPQRIEAASGPAPQPPLVMASSSAELADAAQPSQAVVSQHTAAQDLLAATVSEQAARVDGLAPLDQGVPQLLSSAPAAAASASSATVTPGPQPILPALPSLTPAVAATPSQSVPCPPSTPATPCPSPTPYQAPCWSTDLVPLAEAFPPDVKITLSDCVPVPVSSLVPSKDVPGFASVPVPKPAPAVTPVVPPEPAPISAPVPAVAPAVSLAVTPASSPVSAPPVAAPSLYVAPLAAVYVPAPEEPAIPDSNFRSLRDDDNAFHLNGGRTINFAPNQIKALNSQPGCLIGTDGNDLLDPNLGTSNSSVNAQAGPFRRLAGGGGDDVINGSKGDDILWGGDGKDLLWGKEGDDQLYGENGDDQLIGGDGNDLLSGGAGADRIFAGLGNDRIWGGDGDDELYGNDLRAGVTKGLEPGQTDDDQIVGGAGNDSISGGLGNDQLWGGIGNDSLYGDEGDDKLYGDEGNDRLYGGAGNDVLQGGDGDDVLYGDYMRAYAAATNDIGGDDLIYGGAGNDSLYGSVGNDLLDGGSGNDYLEGGKGDDTYLVDCSGDTVAENANEGHDTVIASCSLTLATHVEDLHLAEGGNFNGSGNTLDNLITGNSQDNLLDGGQGADTMIGGKGNDTYVVDNVGDKVVEQAGEGIDSVQSKISYTLGENLENLSLMDSTSAQAETINGKAALVYGFPHNYDLDYSQGDEVPGYKGTCGETSVANICIMSGLQETEADVVKRAIANGWCRTQASDDASRGGCNQYDQMNLLKSFGLPSDCSYGYDQAKLAGLLKDGRGVLIAVNAGKLWDDPDYVQGGVLNHVVTVTGVACDASSGDVLGFYIADSGRGQAADANRYLSTDDMRKVADAYGANMVYTLDPIKIRNENIDATGNALDNVLTGNRGNNILTGGRGDDTLIGGAGNDTYVFTRGDGRDQIIDNDATRGNQDVLQFKDAKQTNLWFSQVGQDLQIDVLGSSDRVTVKDWYVGGKSGTDHHVERIKTADGSTLYDSDVAQLVQAMASFAPPAALQTEWTSGQTSAGKVLLTVTH
jgi:Ca2+-binding RTX toxin-like protein